MKQIKCLNSNIHEGELILVNFAYPYHEDKNQLNVVSLKNDPTILLNQDAVGALEKLMDSIQGGDQFVGVSGYRSMDEQTRIYNQSLVDSGEEFTSKYVALPGCSEHQTGFAIDLTLKSSPMNFICPDFPSSGICKKFKESAHLYGFVERYGKHVERITHISHEPWHFRYVGYPHSLIMHELNLCLEEYHAFIQNYVFDQNPFSYDYENTAIEISYVQLKSIEINIKIDDSFKWSLSGNNINGFVYAKWR